MCPSIKNEEENQKTSKVRLEIRYWISRNIDWISLAIYIMFILMGAFLSIFVIVLQLSLFPQLPAFVHLIIFVGVMFGMTELAFWVLNLLRWIWRRERKVNLCPRRSAATVGVIPLSWIMNKKIKICYNVLWRMGCEIMTKEFGTHYIDKKYMKTKYC